MQNGLPPDENVYTSLLADQNDPDSFINRMSKSRKDSEKTCTSASYFEIMRYATYFDWLFVIFGLLFSCLSGALCPTASIIFKGITNTLMKGQADYNAGELDMEWFTNEMLLYIKMYFHLGAVIFVLEYCAMSCFFTNAEKQVHQIRKMYFASILNQDIAYFDSNEVGKLTQQMSGGIDRIQNGISDKILILTRSFSSLIAGIIIAFNLNWQMTLLMLLILPIVILTIWGSSKSVKKTLKKEIDAYESAGAVAEEVLNGIRTVLAFNGQEFEANRYTSLLQKGCRSGIVKALFSSFFSGLYVIVLFPGMGIAFWFGTNLVIDGTTSPGTVFACFWSVVIGAMQVGQALPQIATLVGARIAAGEIFSVIDRKPELDCSSTTGVKPTNIKGKIEFDDVHFSYPSRQNVNVLRGVSFTVEPGQKIAFVGKSGCGKSTIVGLLLRYYEQNRGSIVIDGVPLKDLNIEWLRKTIGVVSQEPVIFATTVEENLRMGKEDLTEKDVISACIKANAHEFIERLPNRYQTRIGEGGIRLSGGQKQRLAIARALVKNPKILILDESTSALDTHSEQIVQEAIDQASSERTIITIAHRLSTIRQADKILVFDNGRIIESGSHFELMELNGVYSQLVLAQEISQEENVIDDEILDNESSELSRRLRDSMVSIKSPLTISEPDLDDKREELKDENAKEASLLDIFKFAKTERLLILIGLLFTCLRGLSTPIFSILYGRLFNTLSSVFSKQQIDITNENIIHFASFSLLGLFSGLTSFLSGSCFGIFGEKFAMRLRSKVFTSLLRQDGYFYDNHKHSTGKLTARLSSDSQNVQAAIDQRLAEVLQGLVALFCGISIAFYFGWRMAPIGILTAVTIVVIQLLLTGYLKRRAQHDMEIAEEASRLAAESIEHVRTVQALTIQTYLNQRFCEASRKPHRRAIVRGFLQAMNYALMATFVNLNFGCAYLFGLMLVRNGLTTPFVVFQVIESLNMASISIMVAANYFPEYLRAKVSAGLMFNLIRDQPQIDSTSDNGKKPEIKGKIELKDVHFAYPNSIKHMVLSGFNIKAEQGKSIALCGISGSGKSTTIALLEHYYDILCGNIKIDGVDIREINIRHLRSNITLVEQTPTLFNLSIAENIAYGLENVTFDEIVEAAKLANIHEFINSLPKKYQTLCGGRGSQLSGGQKQRICIARAIIRKPKILLLDEATSALDTASEKVVQEALDKASQGRTTITIAHRLSTIQNSDSIAVVKDGRVVEIGNHKSLLNQKGLYYRLVQKQS